MTILTLMFHIIACVILILVVLLQSGKAADLSAFAGGGSQTAFGARGGQTVLAKLTTGAAVVFMCTSLGLGILSSRGSQSVLENLPAGQETNEPGQAAPPGTETPAVPQQTPPAETGAPETETGTADQGPAGAAARPDAGPETDQPPQGDDSGGAAAGDPDD